MSVTTRRPQADRSTAHRTKLLEGLAEDQLLIHEIYRSLQGESTHAGLPCTFIRLSVCQMRCRYCDTPHAFHQGSVRTIEEVFDQAMALGPGLVEVTGGEPLLQAGVYSLMTRLADAGRIVLLETGGGVSTQQVDPRVCTILDVKTPGSGEAEANVWENFERLRPHDEVKFVLCDRNDFDWSVEIIRSHQLTERNPVLMSVAFGQVEPTDVAAWILQTGLPIRFQIQLHKVIWDPKARGV